MKLGDLFGTRAGEGTFLALPRCENVTAADADVAVLGAPIATPYPAFGSYAAGAPAALRAASVDFVSPHHHFDFDVGGPLLGEDEARVVDCGDVPGDPEDAAGNRGRITRDVRTLLELGAVPVVIGGDDSVPIPVFGAYEGRGPFTVVQVDAHIDWRDEVNGERLGLSSTMRRASEMAWVERIVQVGARGMGSARREDRDAARAFGAHIVTAREVHERGIAPILDLVPAGAEVLITVDCDGLDPGVLPAVMAPAPGGLDYWQVVGLIQGLAARARIAGFDIVEFMPERDVASLGAVTATRIVCNAIACAVRQTRGQRPQR